jgi:hypothetical protein
MTAVTASHSVMARAFIDRYTDRVNPPSMRMFWPVM